MATEIATRQDENDELEKVLNSVKSTSKALRESVKKSTAEINAEMAKIKPDLDKTAQALLSIESTDFIEKSGTDEPPEWFLTVM